METKNVLFELRTKNGLTQGELADKVFVTRQAVSRWETGETQPNVDTLKLLSKLFDVSINTLLGSPRRLICQCCGMPLDDSSISREPDGSFNEEYCKWCYTDGKFVYGYAVATDTGIAVQKGQILVDLFYETYAESVINGAIQVNVYVVD